MTGTATWTDVSYDLGDIPINDVVRDDVTGDLYAASDFGVFRLLAGVSLAGTYMPGLRILTETVTSPTLANQLRELQNDLPLAKWDQYEPINRDNSLAGARLAFGEYVETRYAFDKAAVVLSLDAGNALAPAAVEFQIGLGDILCQVGQAQEAVSVLSRIEVVKTGDALSKVGANDPAFEPLVRIKLSTVSAKGNVGAAVDVDKEIAAAFPSFAALQKLPGFDGVKLTGICTS